MRNLIKPFLRLLAIFLVAMTVAILVEVASRMSGSA